MNMPQGYKHTELGIVPEDWKVVTIGELGPISKGSGISRTDANTGKIPCVRYGELYTHHNDYIKSFNSFISRDVSNNAKLIKCGDILFAASGETKEEIGKSVAFIDDFEAYAGGDIIILSTNYEICDAKYIGYISNASFIVKQKAAKGQGDAVVHITSDNIKNIIIPLPPLSEQKAIAQALTDVDNLIAALDKQISKKRLLKQGAMQQLLTGKKRLPGFSGEWEYDVIANICDILDNRRIPINDEQRKDGIYPYCGANGIVAYIDKYIFDEDLILIAEDGGNFDQFETRPIAYWMTGKYWVNNHAHVLKAKQNYCQKYIYYQLEHKDITGYIVGGTRTKLTRTQLDSIRIELPKNIAEQQEIAMILSDMDNEIANLETKREKYRLIKQGMMQKLFTGQIRLKKLNKK